MFKALFFLISFSSMSYASTLIGKIVPPYPDGVTSKSGACISKALGLLKVCDYSIGMLENVAGELMGLYLGKKEGRSVEGQTTWKVIDQIPYPLVKSGQALMIATCQLMDKDEIDESIVAVANIGDGEWLTNIVWAYKGNFNEGKFTKIDVSHVKCINDGLGNE